MRHHTVARGQGGQAMSPFPSRIHSAQHIFIIALSGGRVLRAANLRLLRQEEGPVKNSHGTGGQLIGPRVYIHLSFTN